MPEITKLNFFTPVSYKYCKIHSKATFRQKLTSTVDNYFYLTGFCANEIPSPRAYVIPNKALGKGRAVEIRTHYLARDYIGQIFKVISYATIILPIIFLALKIILRLISPYYDYTRYPEMMFEKRIPFNDAEIKLLKETVDQLNQNIVPDTITVEEKGTKSQYSMKKLETWDTYTFRLKSRPDLLFYYPGDLLHDERINLARLVIRHGFKQVSLPASRIMTIPAKVIPHDINVPLLDRTRLIVEKDLEYQNLTPIQEIFKSPEEKYDSIIKELTLLVHWGVAFDSLKGCFLTEDVKILFTNPRITATQKGLCQKFLDLLSDRQRKLALVALSKSGSRYIRGKANQA